VIWRPVVRNAGSFVAAAGGLPTVARVQGWIAAIFGIGIVALMLFPDRPRRRGSASCSTTIAVLVAFLSAILPGPLAWNGPARAWANGGPGARTTPLPTVIANPVDLRFHHYHADERGTPLLITDGSGSVVEHVRVRAFGEVRGRWNADGMPSHDSAGFGFAGYADEPATGLQYAGSRWYDPALGSFLSHDPARQFPNPYLYGSGDPLNGIDHAGAIFGLDDLFIAIIIGAIAGAVGGGIQAAIDGASLGQALKAAAIGGAIGGASAGVGAGIIGPALADTVVPTLAGQLVRAGVAAPTASTVAGVAVYGTTIGSGLAQAGYQASRGNWGPLIGLGVAVGLTATIPPQPAAAPTSGVRTVATSTSQELPNMSVADLRSGDVLLTEDGGVASVTGHSAVVIEAEGDIVRVLSSDNRGRYIETNLDPAVGGRQWDVYRIEGVDPSRLRAIGGRLDSRGGLREYFGNGGGNVCSSTCALAIEQAGGPAAPRAFSNLVFPAALRETYGPPIGRVFIPKLGSI
jgi:RHS repeat-associated protein